MNHQAGESAAGPLVVIACGGTGGHLYPGLAVAEELLAQGYDIGLMVSPKDVDQRAVRAVRDMTVWTLPAVGLERGRVVRFVRGFVASWRQARSCFRARRPAVVLAMGGFTSAPPVVAGRQVGAATLLHEANSIPGRANRWLASWVNEGLVYFPQAAARLRTRVVTVTGMPVRSAFEAQEASACRLALGLHPDRPVLLVMGGSQGAGGINELALRALPGLMTAQPEMQWVHLTGLRDAEKVQAAVKGYGVRGIVRPFLTEMELALGAATVAVCRAGASSIAELAAMRVPSILIPFPQAADNHQWHNADALLRTGAAVVLEQASTTPARFTAAVLELWRDPARRQWLSEAIGAWHKAEAAALVAARVMDHVPRAARRTTPSAVGGRRLEVVVS